LGIEPLTIRYLIQHATLMTAVQYHVPRQHLKLLTCGYIIPCRDITASLYIVIRLRKKRFLLIERREVEVLTNLTQFE
jgi:hypothetical protein